VTQQFGARYAIALGAVAALGAGTWGMVQARKASPAPVPIPDVLTLAADTDELPAVATS
jgi:hypothetical protein